MRSIGFPKGYIVFSDGLQATLQFSIPKESQMSDRNLLCKADWSCFKVNDCRFAQTFRTSAWALLKEIFTYFNPVKNSVES